MRRKSEAGQALAFTALSLVVLLGICVPQPLEALLRDAAAFLEANNLAPVPAPSGG